MLSLLVFTALSMDAYAHERSSIAFSVLDSDESKLFVRFVQSVGLPVRVVVGGKFIVEVDCSDSEFKELADRYESEFGVDIHDRDATGLIRNRFPVLVIASNDPISYEDLGSTYGTRSLLFRAYNSVVVDGQVSKRDRIKRFSYRLRPWITEDGLRAAVITGNLHTVSGIREVRVFFVDVGR